MPRQANACEGILTFCCSQDLKTIAAKIRGWNATKVSHPLLIEAPEIFEVQNGSKLDSLAAVELAPRAGVFLTVQPGAEAVS